MCWVTGESGALAAVSTGYGLNRTGQWARRVNCSSEADVSCLRRRSAEALVLAAGEDSDPITNSGWSVTWGADFADMPEHPFVLWGRNPPDVPILAGFNSNEGSVTELLFCKTDVFV